MLPFQSTAYYQSVDGVVKDGLLLYWSAWNPVSYPGTGSTVYDLVGTQTGSFENGTTFSTNYGGTWGFDGVNDRIFRQPVTTTITQTFSISCWVRTTDTSDTSQRFVLSFGLDNTPAGEGGLFLFAYYFSSIASKAFFIEMGSGKGRVTSTIVPVVNQWYHLTATADGTNTRFYIDGNLIGSASMGNGRVAPNPSLSVGSFVNGSGTPLAYWHKGDIGSVTVYTKTLSDQEVRINFDAGRSRYGV